MAHALQHHVIRLADLQTIDREFLRAVAKFGDQRPQFLPGRNGAADIQREQSFIRPFALRPGQRTHERRGGVEIEPLRFQFRFNPRAAVCLPVRHRNPSLDGATIDLGFHRVDGKAVLGHGDVAAQPQRLLAAIGDVAAALQPGHQRIRIGGFDVERSLEMVGRPLRAGFAQRDPGRARRAKLQPVDAPGSRVAMQFGGDILQGTSAQHDLLGGEFDLRRNRDLRNSRHQHAQRRQHANRLSRAAVLGVLGEKAVGIELPCRERRAQQRRSAETKVAIAGEFQRAVFRAIGRLDRLQPRGRIVGLDPRPDPPGRLRSVVAAQLLPDRCGQRHRALEPRGPRIETQHTIEVGRKRALAGIDIEVNARAVAVRPLSGRDAKRVARA